MKSTQWAAGMSSVKTKLTTLVVTAVVSSVLLVSLASAWRDADRRLSAKRAEMSGIASAIATSVAHPLASGDSDSVARTLSTIGRIPGFTFARVSDVAGKTVHQFGFGIVVNREPGLISPNPEITPFSVLYLKTYPVAVPIISGGVQIGKLTLIADLSELNGALWDSLLTALAAGIVASLFGFLLSRRLQASISDPVASLKSAMDDVARSKDFNLAVQRTSDDEIGRLVDAFNDMMSEVRVRDAALAAHRDNLENEVDIRTRQLQSATQAAEAASAAKSEFLATMSHEIRTPMNGMLVMAELLATGALTPKLQRYADVLLNSGQSLLAIINDILDFSKIESGKLELESVPVDLRRLIDDTLRLFNGRAASKNLELASDVSSDVALSIAADPVRLTQIVSNLVNNALKFTEHGSVVVRANAWAGADAQGRWIEIHVCDTGIGIPAEKLETIFEAFSQADQSTARRFGGTGIGLTICRRLVLAMGGTISVASENRKGSTFTVRIPVTALAEYPQLPTYDGDDIATVVIAVRPPVLQDILSNAVRRRGLTPVLIAAQDLKPRHMSSARGIIVGSADIAVANAVIEQRRRDSASTTIIAVETFGDNSAADIEGVAVADLMVDCPVSSDDLDDALNAIVRGRDHVLQQCRLAQADAPQEVDISQLRVLAADDNAVNREVLTEALRRLGVQFVCVDNGLAALHVVQSQPIDIVLMDCSMPVMDGFEATRRIREWERNADLPARPVIALTAYVIGEAADAWREAGMTGYLTKPYTLKSLRHTLESSGALNGLSTKHAPQHQDAAGATAAEKSGDLPGGADLIDPSVLGSIREMEEPGELLVERILGLFSQHAPQSLDALRGFTDAAEPGAVAEVAHALRSMGRNIGAVRMADICAALEHDARRGDLTKLDAYCETLSTTVQDTISALTVFADFNASANRSYEPSRSDPLIAKTCS